MNPAFISGSSWSFGQHFGKPGQFVGHSAHLILASAGTKHTFFLGQFERFAAFFAFFLDI